MPLLICNLSFKILSNSLIHGIEVVTGRHHHRYHYRSLSWLRAQHFVPVPQEATNFLGDHWRRTYQAVLLGREQRSFAGYGLFPIGRSYSSTRSYQRFSLYISRLFIAYRIQITGTPWPSWMWHHLANSPVTEPSQSMRKTSGMWNLLVLMTSNLLTWNKLNSVYCGSSQGDQLKLCTGEPSFQVISAPLKSRSSPVTFWNGHGFLWKIS